MGASLCKPALKKIATSSWVGNENKNPFEHAFTRKERIMLRKTYQNLHDPKEVIGQLLMEIVNDVAPELKPLFGVDRAPKATMLKMPKFGGHVVKMADFFEQTTSMMGFTENVVGAWQLVQKTGRLHCKVVFIGENKNNLEKNYFTILTDYFFKNFVGYLTGEIDEPNPAPNDEKNRFGQAYTKQQIYDVWRRFFVLIGNQFTESLEIERQRSLSNRNKEILPRINILRMKRLGKKR